MQRTWWIGAHPLLRSFRASAVEPPARDVPLREYVDRISKSPRHNLRYRYSRPSGSNNTIAWHACCPCHICDVECLYQRRIKSGDSYWNMRWTPTLLWGGMTRCVLP